MVYGLLYNHGVYVLHSDVPLPAVSTVSLSGTFYQVSRVECVTLYRSLTVEYAEYVRNVVLIVGRS